MRKCTCGNKGGYHAATCTFGTDARKIMAKHIEIEKQGHVHTPATVLQEAHEIIYGDREETYGNPSVNLCRIANFWNAHLANMGLNTNAVPVTAADVCMMMAMLKFARQTHQPKRDNLVDAAGYIALIERL